MNINKIIAFMFCITLSTYCIASDLSLNILPLPGSHICIAGAHPIEDAWVSHWKELCTRYYVTFVSAFPFVLDSEKLRERERDFEKAFGSKINCAEDSEVTVLHSILPGTSASVWTCDFNSANFLNFAKTRPNDDKFDLIIVDYDVFKFFKNPAVIAFCHLLNPGGNLVLGPLVPLYTNAKLFFKNPRTKELLNSNKTNLSWIANNEHLEYPACFQGYSFKVVSDSDGISEYCWNITKTKVDLFRMSSSLKEDWTNPDFEKFLSGYLTMQSQNVTIESATSFISDTIGHNIQLYITPFGAIKSQVDQIIPCALLPGEEERHTKQEGIFDNINVNPLKAPWIIITLIG